MTITNNTTTTCEVVTVKCGNFPGQIREYVVPAGNTVEDVLELAEVRYDSDSLIKKNGQDTYYEAEVADGDVIIVAKKVKGN